jgi:hypothetical protein
MGFSLINTPPSFARPVSQACTQSQFDTEPYRFWCDAIREQPRYHRKQWEFCYILQALSTAGALAPGRRGLGFGVGQEPLPAVFANYGCSVVATDLDLARAKVKGWSDDNQHAASAEALNLLGIAKPEIFARNVRFQVADMNAIPPDLTGFDFTWSSCCLEHLGSIEHGLRFIENSVARLLPGGVAVHTTELNCSSDTETIESGHTVLFRRSDLVELARRLSGQGCDLTLNLNIGDQPLDQHVDVPPFTADKHIKLQLEAFTSTSFGLLIRKPG